MKRKRGKSHQVGNLKMQPKKKRILQDESQKKKPTRLQKKEKKIKEAC